MKTSRYLKFVRSLPLAVLGVLIIAGADTAPATTIKKWTDQSFFGSTKAEIRKALGKPDDTGEMDTYLISDSPDLMMMGIIGYKNGKVASVMAVLRPKLTYKKVRDIQIKSDKVKLVSETKEGALFKYKKPAAVGPIFLVIAPPDDKTTGAFFVDSIENPFSGAEAGKSDKKDALSELTSRYTHDDRLLGGSLRYERNQGDTSEQLWVLETGEVVKAVMTTKTAKSETIDEFSLTADGNVYFSFHQDRARNRDDSTRITEERTYFEDFQTIQFSRRTADVPAGATLEIPAKIQSVKLALAKLSDEQRGSDSANEKSKKIIDSLRDPKFLVYDPAKDAPAEWQRIKLVEGTLSPDGRYAFAWAPTKKDFVWKNYVMEDSSDDYWVEPDTEPVVNFIADLKSHTIVGMTPGVHFGVKQNYNHYECITTWSPESSTFIELNTRKWDYAACCIGRVMDGKLTAVQNLGGTVEAKAKELLKTTKHKGYRKNSAEMVVALAEPELKNDGTGSIKVIFQVPKSEEEDTYATVRVRFRLTKDKNQLEMVGAELMKEE